MGVRGGGVIAISAKLQVLFPFLIRHASVQQYYNDGQAALHELCESYLLLTDIPWMA